MRHRKTNEDLLVKLIRNSVTDETGPLTNGAHCRLWQAASNRGGYGRTWDGEKLGYVHRVSYEIHEGPIPPGKDVLHHCDVPGCWEPLHLWAGTPKENTADMIAKGRHLDGRRISGNKHRGKPSETRGENHPKAKLTHADVLAIKAQPKRKGTDLAAEYGISVSSVYAIRQDRLWAWLKPGVEQPPKKEKPAPLTAKPAAEPPRYYGIATAQRQYALDDPDRPQFVGGKSLKEVLRG